MRRSRVRSRIPGGARRWLGKVLRNVAWQARRAERRRRGREERVARAEAQGSTDELVARAELERELVGAVLALEEPYRTTVLPRFFEELPPRVIARRMRVPVETVRTRLVRALARLRTRLEGARPDPRAWLILAAPVTNAHAAAYSLGALLMNTKLKLALAAAAFLGVLGLCVVLDPGGPRVARRVVAGASAPVRPEERGHPDEGRAVLPLTAGQQSTESGARRESPTAVETSAAGQPHAASAGTWLRGRVLDDRGRPLAGIPLGARASGEPGRAGGGGVLATSAADGSFRLAAPSAALTLVACDERFATILAGFVGPTSTAGETIVVVAPSVVLACRVEDEQGEPLPDARLRVLHDGHASAEIPFGPASEENLLVVLPRAGKAEDVVAGIVLDESGRPAAGARVAFGIDSQRTGRDGRFAFPLKDPQSFGARMGHAPDALVAVARGRMPGRFEPPRAADGTRAWPRFVTLQLGLPTLSIVGTVVDHEGRPVDGAQMWLADPSFFGAVDGDLVQLENVLAGVKKSRAQPLAQDREEDLVADLAAQAVDDEGAALVDGRTEGPVHARIEGRAPCARAARRRCGLTPGRPWPMIQAGGKGVRRCSLCAAREAGPRPGNYLDAGQTEFEHAGHS